MLTAQGNEVATLLGLKPGLWLHPMMESILHWEWRNLGVDKEAAMAWVLDQKEALVSSGAVAATAGGKMRKKAKGKEEEVEQTGSY